MAVVALEELLDGVAGRRAGAVRIKTDFIPREVFFLPNVTS